MKLWPCGGGVDTGRWWMSGSWPGWHEARAEDSGLGVARVAWLGWCPEHPQAPQGLGEQLKGEASSTAGFLCPKNRMGVGSKRSGLSWRSGGGWACGVGGEW